ncbi:anti-sigma factor [Nocardia sp. NBC_00508]|uniref:anti-sigma factor n=1 Tax=Nocardia sp. NBC_00508 TaxID=2975992 RepID=UPI002E80431C|nr:anti-sigma factor [Nocardia sp. NBC_00508]WUD65656.1 anti-sigma factor [Nocardia sp. NBC_00508]
MTETEQPRADLLDLAYPYAMDTVAEIERRHIENRVAKADSGTAAAFTATVHRVRETLGALSAVDAANPPPTLESKILRAIDDSCADARSGRRGARSVPRRLPRVARLVVTAALIVGAGAGAVIAERVAAAHRAAPVTAEQVLLQPDSRSRVVDLTVGGTLTVSTSQRLRSVAVTFDAVPAPPPGRAYQLWVVSSAGAVRSAGVLTMVPQAGVSVRFDPADVFVVTIEPADGSRRPTAPQIAAVDLD